MLPAAHGITSQGRVPNGADFSPDHLSNLALWLDASNAATITLSGSDVSVWADPRSIGVTAEQSTGAKQPAYISNAHNGLPALRFTGSEMLNLSSSAMGLFRNLPGAMIYAVVLTTTPATTGWILWLENQQSLNRQRLGVAVSSFNSSIVVAYRIPDTSSTSQSLRSTEEMPADELRLVTSHHDWLGLEGRIYENGAETKSDSLTGTSANSDDTDSNRGRVGSDGFDGNAWRGDICELLVYQDLHTDWERSRVEAYLMSKWGIS